MTQGLIKYCNEIKAIACICGKPLTQTAPIEKPFHHKNRVVKYEGANLAKKYRANRSRSVNKAYQEAHAHLKLERIGVSIPKLFGILHNEEECSLFIEYFESYPLTTFLINGSYSEYQLMAVGQELGKMYEYGFLHGDLASYHILVGDQVHIFDLEETRQYPQWTFHQKLIKEWSGFVNSTQGRRWKIPLTIEQEWQIFEGIRSTLSRSETIGILEKIINDKKAR